MDVPIGNSLVPKTTPMHVSELVLLIIKETFRLLEDGHPFKYTDDFATTGVVFDTIYNKDSEVYGKKPLIIVSRGDMSTSPAILGDLAAQSSTLGNKYKTGLVGSGVTIKVIANSAGLADILSNEVFNILLTLRMMLPNLTSVLTINSLTMGAVATFDDGDHEYYCVGSVNYSMQYKWTHKKPTEILQAIGLHLQDSNSGDTRDVVLSDN